MTIPYNVTNIGIADKLEKYFDKIYIDKENYKNLSTNLITLEIAIQNSQNKTIININKDKDIIIYKPKIDILINKENQNLYFSAKDLLYFAKLIKTTVLNIIPPFNQLKIYFDKFIEIMQKLELPIF